MAIIVQKFGGSCLSDVESIKKAVSFVSFELEKNNTVVVVVSAMYGFTDRLSSYVQEFLTLGHRSDFRERDVVLAAGEQISAGLFALALNNSGIYAKSLMGWQVPIITDDLYSQAFIKKIDTSKISKLLESNYVPVITGFQGVDKDGNITTLQRGGSDTSAVALAVALKAERCDIYGNVDGVYTADPFLVPNSVRISSLNYEEMLEISLYAKVLDNRSVEIAKNNSMPIRVLSSFDENIECCTEIRNEYSVVQSFNFLNVACSKKCAGIEANFSDSFILSKLFVPLTLAVLSSNKMFFVYDYGHKSYIDEVFTNYSDNIKLFSEIVVVNIVGSKISTKNISIFLEITEILKKNFVPIIHSIVSEIKISIIVDYMYSVSVVKLIHDFVLCDVENA